MQPIFLDDATLNATLKCYAESLRNGYPHIDCPDEARPTNVHAYYTKKWVIYLESLQYGIVMERSHFEKKEVIEKYGLFIVVMLTQFLTFITYILISDSYVLATFFSMLTIAYGLWRYSFYWWSKYTNAKHNIVFMSDKFNSLLNDITDNILLVTTSNRRKNKIIASVSGKIAGKFAGYLGGDIAEKLIGDFAEKGAIQLIEEVQMSQINKSIDNVATDNKYLIGFLFNRKTESNKGTGPTTAAIT